MRISLERFAQCDDCPVEYRADDSSLVAQAARLHRQESGHTVREYVLPVL